MALPEAAHETIAHFLTEFSHNQSLCKTEDYIRKFLARRYAPDVADEIILKHYKAITSVLIDEHDRRRQSHNLLRYTFSDDEGDRIRGIGDSWARQYRIFQDALNGLTDSEFEALSARFLAILGCDTVWTTPASHDQGLDSFGYSIAFDTTVPKEIRQQCRIVFLAQAKHYNKHKIGSRDLREFVGAVELAIHKIFSTVDSKYNDLTIMGIPFTPLTLSRPDFRGADTSKPAPDRSNGPPTPRKGCNNADSCRHRQRLSHYFRRTGSGGVKGIPILTIKPFGPTVMVLMTTQEIPYTVKTIGRNAGIVVLSAQDLAIALSGKGIVSGSRWTKKSLIKDLKHSLQGIPCAR